MPSEPLGPGCVGALFGGLAAIGALVVCGVGLAIALQGKHGISGLGPIAWAALAALLLTPTAAIAGYLLGKQRAEQQIFDEIASEGIDDPPPNERDTT